MGDDGDDLAILISDRQPLPIDREGLARLAREALRGEGVERAGKRFLLGEQRVAGDLPLHGGYHGWAVHGSSS